MDSQTVLAAVAGVPATVAVTNLIKKSVDLGRWSAFVAVLISMGLNVAVSAHAGEDLFIGAMRGLILGLAASGLYDLTPSDPENPIAIVTDDELEDTEEPDEEEGEPAIFEESDAVAGDDSVKAALVERGRHALGDDDGDLA